MSRGDDRKVPKGKEKSYFVLFIKFLYTYRTEKPVPCYITSQILARTKKLGGGDRIFKEIPRKLRDKKREQLLNGNRAFSY